MVLNPARGVMEIGAAYPGPAPASYQAVHQAAVARTQAVGRNYLDLGYSQAVGTETAKFSGQVEQGQRWQVQERALDELIGVHKMPIGVQELVPPVNYDKKKSRKKFQAQPTRWMPDMPDMRLAAEGQQQMQRHPHPIPSDMAQFDVVLQNNLNQQGIAKMKPGLRTADTLVLQQMPSTEVGGHALGQTFGGGPFNFQELSHHRSPIKRAGQVDYPNMQESPGQPSARLSPQKTQPIGSAMKPRGFNYSMPREVEEASDG